MSFSFFVITTQEKSVLEKQLAEITKKLNDIQNQVSVFNRELAQEKSKKEQLKLKVSTLRNPRLLAELTAFDEARQKMREEIVKLQSEAHSIEQQVSNMMKLEEERMHQLIKGHEKEQTAFTSELEDLTKKIEHNEEQLKQKEKVQRAFFSEYKDLFQKRDKLSDQNNVAERKIDTLRDNSRRTEIEMNNFSLKLAAMKSELAGLDEQLAQLKNAKILKGKSEDELKSEISKFEKMLSTMSAVNMKAQIGRASCRERV